MATASAPSTPSSEDPLTGVGGGEGATGGVPGGVGGGQGEDEEKGACYLPPVIPITPIVLEKHYPVQEQSPLSGGF